MWRGKEKAKKVGRKGELQGKGEKELAGDMSANDSLLAGEKPRPLPRRASWSSSLLRTRKNPLRHEREGSSPIRQIDDVEPPHPVTRHSSRQKRTPEKTPMRRTKSACAVWTTAGDLIHVQDAEDRRALELAIAVLLQLHLHRPECDAVDRIDDASFRRWFVPS